MAERSNAAGLVHLDVKVIRRETPAAFNVVLDNGQIWWLPRSQVHDADDYQAGDRNVTMTIPEWLYDKKVKGEP